MANTLKPFFSIIIPSLNEEKYLPQLLGDLVAQTSRDFEVIIVDGHSKDLTVANAQKFQSKLNLSIYYSKIRHVCTQRNLGAKFAKGNIFVFMDADNRIPHFFLQGLKYRLESDPGDIATCYLQPDSPRNSDKSIALAINIGHDLLKNSSGATILEALVISTRHAFSTIGGFDEKINLSEGSAFARTARKLNLTYKVYKDPVYTYSFRRMRKYGSLNLIGRLAQHEIAKLLDIPISDKRISELYPMRGGSFFELPRSKRNKFTTSIQKIIKDLRSPDLLKQSINKLLEE